MTGNDIVDIKVAATESNWRRKGFVEKIFSLQERQYINDAAITDEMVWKLWTMKESAYKVYIRQYGGRFFAPQKFCCTLLTETTGTVEYDNIIYQTNTITAKHYIYTIAKQKELSNVEFINSCFSLPQTQHPKMQQSIYKKITECYNLITGGVSKNIFVTKDKNGIPFLYCGDNLQIPISITHHGHFAAFTITNKRKP